METKLINNNITNIGISVILLYSIIQTLQFYGIGLNAYGSYVSFYVFLYLSTFILPKEYPKLT